MAFHLFNFSLSVSLSLSLSLSLLFFSFFLLVFLLLLSFGSFFFSLSFFFCLLCFCFMKNNNIKIFNSKVFFSSILCHFLVFCLVFSLKSPFLIFVFADFQLCFLFSIIVFGFKNTIFWSRGELQQNVFFIACVLQNVKSNRFFLPLFWPKFGRCSKTL